MDLYAKIGNVIAQIEAKANTIDEMVRSNVIGGWSTNNNRDLIRIAEDLRIQAAELRRIRLEI